ncbi:MAG: tetratricopeptide repeat protein [Chloroflexota bacterium]
MSFTGTNSRSKVVREMAARARELAMHGHWREAIELNKQLIERSPRDVDALNRLGKAYFELERYRSAYEAYTAAAEADPANIIARRNLERLEPLRDIEADDAENIDGAEPPARYGAFIEEAGKTYVDDLINPAPSAQLRTLSAGEKLEIVRDGNKLAFEDRQGQYVGTPEPRLERRLIWLLDRGVTFDVFVTANAGDRVRVIIREVERGPEMGNEMSFPQQVKASVPRAYVRDSRLFRADENDLIIPTDEDDEDLDDDELLEDDADESEEAAVDDDEEEDFADDEDEIVIEDEGN